MLCNEIKIRKKTLDLILEASRSSHPNEFAALLRMRKKVITEIVLLPGTISGSSSAIYRLHMLPFDFTIRGTVHSHPSGSCYPSAEDLHMFSRFGDIHIIVVYPYDKKSWKAFNTKGENISVELCD